MPVTIQDLERSFSIHFNGPVKWNTPIPSTKPGVYVISLSDRKDTNTLTYPSAPIDSRKIISWISSAGNENPPSSPVPGEAAVTPAVITAYLEKSWLPDESIVYIGKAGSSLKNRLSQFYRHTLGKRSPHAGGQRLLALSCVNNLSVFWAEIDSTVQQPWQNDDKDASTGVGIITKVKKDSAEQLETLLLNYFKRVTGQLPWANRK